MMTFTTNTGKEFNYLWCGIAFTGNLVIAISGATVSEVLSFALNSQETSSITFTPDAEHLESQKTVTGYTKFVGVIVNSDQSINLTLGKETAA